MQIEAYAAHAASEPLRPFTYDAEPGPGEVLIAVSHCGICHSDLHLVDGEWGDHFPLVPGHEVVGTIVRGGSLEPGTRVGLGWQAGSCGSCEWCAAGDEVYCDDSVATCMGHHGGFGSHVIAQERFVIPLPEELDAATAAPLLCAGATVFTPLQRWTDPGMRVGVLGIGGLGHLALGFASALGCEVVACSRDASKEQEARDLGADDFLVGVPPHRSLDLLINTAPASPDMGAWLGSLRPRGVFVQVGASPEPLVVSSGSIIDGDRAVAGSAIAHPRVLREMLDFAALYGVEAQVERFAMSDVNAALDHVRAGKARYRVVLER